MNENMFEIILGDITKMKVDAIVNAANHSLLGGGGVDGAIHRQAGPLLLEECRSLHGCHTGEAKITKGYQLPAAYVFHTVGPIYNGQETQKQELSDCYMNALTLASEHNLHSIAFPAISTGAYGYPLEEACQIAILSISHWLEAHPDYLMKIYLVCFDQSTYDCYDQLMGIPEE